MIDRLLEIATALSCPRMLLGGCLLQQYSIPAQTTRHTDSFTVMLKDYVTVNLRRLRLKINPRYGTDPFRATFHFFSLIILDYVRALQL